MGSGVSDNYPTLQSSEGFSASESAHQVSEHRFDPTYSSYDELLELLAENEKAAAEQFPLNQSGNFGSKGISRRVIWSEDPVGDARRLYDILSEGATRRVPLESWKHGEVAHFSPPTEGLKDTTITFREITSTAGSPGIRIDISRFPTINNQTIHFILR